MYNLDEVVVPNLNYSMLDPESSEQNFFELAAKQSILSQLKIFRHLSGQVNRVLDQTYSDAGVQSILRHGQFDLLLLSQVVSYAGYPLAWHFQCPFILSSPNVLMTDSAYLLGDSEHTVIYSNENLKAIKSEEFRCPSTIFPIYYLNSFLT
jgi:glucuronosyltransferase